MLHLTYSTVSATLVFSECSARFHIIPNFPIIIKGIKIDGGSELVHGGSLPKNKRY